MTLARKLAGFAEEMRRSDLSPADKLFRVAQRSVRTLRLSPGLMINRGFIVEIAQPPKMTRGLSDLICRRGDERDIPALAAVENGDPALFRARLARGDLAYLGQVGDQVVCHTWFHRGPEPFGEERSIFAPWAVDESTFWSYDANARVEARASGVVAKLFQHALREVFEMHGAKLVRGFIYFNNHPSLILHRRLGFTVLGRVTAVVILRRKWLRWESGGSDRRWLLRRDSDFALPPSAV